MYVCCMARTKEGLFMDLIKYYKTICKQQEKVIATLVYRLGVYRTLSLLEALLLLAAIAVVIGVK